MNEVASKCCGSCNLWNDNTQICREHNEYCQGSHLSCKGEDYSPRNPIPLIQVPGVKELVKTAFTAGYNEAAGCDEYLEVVLADYLKALEVRNE